MGAATAVRVGVPVGVAEGLALCVPGESGGVEEALAEGEPVGEGAG